MVIFASESFCQHIWIWYLDNLLVVLAVLKSNPFGIFILMVLRVELI